jgi:4-amino-4-deoxy-L-arabinose transferase-like glycosyltransferase
MIVFGTATLLFLVRLLAPPNLLDQDQENPGAYVLDVLQNGNWVCQHDLGGGITSKPPFYTWCAALVSLACGRVSLFSLYLPGALALFGSAWLMLRFGAAHFGWRAGIWTALACFFCSAGMKEFGLARTDGVFAFTVTAAALLAYRAWNQGRGWSWFWIAAATATLTKGPLGLLLASAGLLAIPWEQRSGTASPMRGSHVLGVVLYLACSVGWFAAAYYKVGPALYDKLIRQELVFHLVEGEQKKPPGSMFYLSPLYYLARAAPWSLLGYFGLWRIWKHPAVDPEQRRCERFLFCWFVPGLLLFSVAPHQRGDLLWPIMPAAALIVGRELDRLAPGLSPRVFKRLVAGVILFGSAGFAVYYFGPRGKYPLAEQSTAVKLFAQAINDRWGPAFPLTHTDDPAALQVFLNTFNPPTTFARAADLLRGPEVAYVAVSDMNKLNAARRAGDPPIHTVLQSGGPVASMRVGIVCNHGEIGATRHDAFWLGPLLIRYQGQLLHFACGQLALQASGSEAEVQITNASDQTQQVHLQLHNQAGTKNEVVLTIRPGETQVRRF